MLPRYASATALRARQDRTYCIVSRGCGKHPFFITILQKHTPVHPICVLGPPGDLQGVILVIFLGVILGGAFWMFYIFFGGVILEAILEKKSDVILFFFWPREKSLDW